MTEDQGSEQQQPASTPKGPKLTYTSPFAAPPQPAGAEAAAAPPPAPERSHLAAAGAGLAALVVAATAAGALLGHEFWTSTRTVTAQPAVGSSPAARPSAGAPGAATAPGSFSIGGITIGPNGISFGNSSGTAPATGSGGASNAAAIAAKVNPALVDINTTYSYAGGAGAGTGIVVTSNGRVLTNNHVIDGATRITATDVGNGRTYEATVVGYDPSHDIAVLQLQGASGLATAKLGDSSKLAVGQRVVGIGNAGGVGGTPSSAGGEITALNRSITAGDELGGHTEPLSGLIETDADIAAGDSGGPLVDARGRVIGMNTAGSGVPHFGFGGNQPAHAYAIPIGQVAETARQIVAGQASETVHVGASAFLGVQLQSPDHGFGFGGSAAGGSSAGVEVGDVVSGQPAEQAGLGPGDTITAIDGHSVDTPSDVSKVMLAHHPGDTIELRWTDASGQSQTASVRLATGPPA